MARRDYLNDPEAPKANSIVPAASAIVTDRSGRILLHRRSDNDLWGLPGGGMELGESISQTIVREVREETGLDVEPRYVIGIYTNPRHVIAFADGEVRQEFSVCFACKIVGGALRVSEESSELAFFSVKHIANLEMHESIRQRVSDYRRGRTQAVIR